MTSAAIGAADARGWPVPESGAPGPAPGSTPGFTALPDLAPWRPGAERAQNATRTDSRRGRVGICGGVNNRILVALS